MAKDVTPSGLEITRNGNKFTLSWKKKGAPKAVEVQWRTKENDKDMAWNNISVSKTATEANKEITMTNYYPSTNTKLNSLTFKVRAKKTKKKWSAWVSKEYVFTIPKAPSVSQELSADQTNVTKFSWSLETSDTDTAHFVDVEWQTILQNGYNADSIKAIANWSSLQGYASGKGVATSEHTHSEKTTTISSGSHTRWFRVRSRGCGGASSWAYTKHIYATPQQADVTSAPSTDAPSGGVVIQPTWDVDEGSNAFPIDNVVVQYVATIPDSGLAVPAGASWTDANVSVDVGKRGAASVEVDTAPTSDQVLFIRVNTVHDRTTTLGTPTITKFGKLKTPSNLSVSTNNTTYKATVTCTNNSDVPDSYLAVKYCPTSNPNGKVLGIIPHGSNSVVVQCPNWSSETAIAFKVYAVQGSYTTSVKSGVTTYRINANMTSDYLSDGGAVPVAPNNVSVSATEIKGTVQVKWDWTWTDATGAEISWADHADAWESTDAPSTYNVSDMNASKWNISDLETGITWYFRVRLYKGDGDSMTYGAYSPTVTKDLSSAPITPVMKLSNGVIAEDGMTTATWAYTSGDGTPQSFAQICEATYSGGSLTYGRKIASTKTAQHIDIYAEDVGWHAGEVHYLCLKVKSESGRLSAKWSDPAPVIIAEPMTCSIVSTSLANDEIKTNPQSYSGDILTFSRTEQPDVVSLSMDINPYQDLSGGDPSPTNICPIEGYDFATVCATGKNQYNANDGLVGMWCNDNNVIASSANAYSFILPCKPNTTYTISKQAGVMFRVWYNHEYPNSGVSCYGRISSNTASSITITTDAYARYLCGYVWYSSGDTITMDEMADTIQVEIGSTATTYEAYKGNSYPLPFFTTVYYGSLNATSGALTSTYGAVDMGGLPWKWTSASGGYFYVSASDFTDKANGNFNLSSSILKTSTATTITNMNDNEIKGNGSSSSINVKCSTYSGDVDAFVAAVSGQTLIYELDTAETYTIPKQSVQLVSEDNYLWTDCGDTAITIADYYRTFKGLKTLPLNVKVSGAGKGGNVTVVVERADDYFLERPDENQFVGYKGEAVVIKSRSGNGTVQIKKDDLIGMLDDGADYRIVATVNDELGQSATDTLDFTVNWSHQALVPTATIALNEDVMLITPNAPVGTQVGDTCDIYRLSVDRPQLILEGASFGTQYVDPFPTLGDYGGYRVVFKTKYGDYITSSNILAWTDYGKDEGVYYYTPQTIINFGDDAVSVMLNMKISNAWEKDFQETRYLGGSVKGDWNPSVSRTGSVKAVGIRYLDQETIQALHRLADYSGICHVRTPDGANFHANVEVNIDADFGDSPKTAEVSLNFTRVDGQELDGAVYADWIDGDNE